MPEQKNHADTPSYLHYAESAPNQQERERRLVILQSITAHAQQHGAPVARAHPERARQFMPFAALKGYHELVRKREHVPEEKHTLTEEQAAELSQKIAALSKGSMATITHYEEKQYKDTCGIVSEINEAERYVRVIKKRIAFEDIRTIEVPE